MTISTRKGLILLSVLFFILPIVTYAQVGMPVAVRPCGTDRLLTQLRKDPAFVAREKAINQALAQKHYTRASAAPPAVVTLPVVVHIINENPNAYTDAAVIQAIQSLNDAYSASGTFTGGRTDTRIQFCLAKTAPDGGRTTGIVRTHSFLSDFDYDMEADELIALGAWDRKRYINIWLVSNIRSEYMQDFSCGTWTRLTMGGYAGAGGDVVVSGLGVDLVAHEMGHYLSLAHTFAARDCRNDDCLTDGDMVCDTPPERTIQGGGCTAPQNSCDTDSLSGFTTDVDDLPDNFMDYGSGAGCIMGFTPGQAERMQNFIATALPLMVNSTVCNDPCGAAVSAAFTRNIDYPVTGDAVVLTAAATAGLTLQWLVDGTPVGTGPTYTFTVTAKKTYQLELRVTDNASGCKATVTDAFQVSCGVVARFYPSKRKIASKENIETDHVVFTNRSRNATAWKWLMSNDKGMAEQVVSTDEQLDHIFKVPGTYKVRLYATNGACEDTTNPVTIVVDDPTADGVIHVESVTCYNQDKVRVQLWFENRGYVTIPKGTPVSFYDADPRTGTGNKLGNSYLLPVDLPGKCASYKYTTTVDVGRAYLDTLVSVMCDNGTTMPLALPNTGLPEQSYNNNINIKKGFMFRAALNPKEYTLKPADQVTLEPVVTNGSAITSATWAPSPYLNCINCTSTTFTALYRQDTLATVSVRAYTNNGCYSDDTAKVHIPVVDDYTVKLNNLECSGTDNLHVAFSLCNAYTQGNIPASLQVDFYDRSPNDPAAVKLGNSFLTPGASAAVCSDYEHSIQRTTTGNVFAVVNKDRQAFPVTSGLNEIVYDNNIAGQTYTTPVLTVLPNDTTVFRKDPFSLYYNVTGFTPVSVLWNNSSAYTLSCTNCASPVATMLDSSMVSMQVTNKYGCVLKGEEYVHIFPPDMTVEMLSAECYDDTHIQVKFRVCMGNGYDTVYKQIPVSFYNGTPGDGQTVLLSPGYYTPAAALGPCLEFTHIVTAPGSSEVVAVINEQKEGAFNETNYTNNQSNLKYDAFTITATPNIITLARPGNVTLQTAISGGTAGSYLWEPASGLSCTNCAEPVATASSSMKYLVTATNSHYCKDTANILIQTFVKTGVAMPNAFSPNGDGRNDVFYVMGGLDIRKVKNLSVFNRYGQKLFESLNSPANDRKFGWDGRVNGKRVEFDTYVYFAAVEYIDGTVQTFKGTIIVTP
ncbi:T9SS type B sorting domain-containing protein [Niastella sp. OAS944]|uniref:T9SS type B sorting domain-containing protein n=1 Tax=Niastella sp. OAS944 TaxID=2664089 RepID=UPI00346A7591|nr:gliding motility-associated-like protein [Chitinophagaceae bacterium OAS944]